ncbi:MAG TPA: TetR/AcrR family transcriptional regulator [Acidimicrobiales bacterium]|nr:TetR/AcrR family transcriptional regulator [Acidimicrobiales bacterium]
MAEPVAPAVLTVNQRARRQRVVDAGLALLGQRDYERIQVKDVAEEAGVALGTLYHYFSSKEHLFAEVLVKWAGTLRTNLTRHPLSAGTPQERLTEALHRSIRAFQRQPQLARLVAALEMSSDPFATEILARLDQTTTAVYLELLPGIEARRARRIVRTADAVFDSMLRAWSAGRLPIVDLYDYVSDAVALLFDEPVETADATSFGGPDALFDVGSDRG